MITSVALTYKPVTKAIEVSFSFVFTASPSKCINKCNNCNIFVRDDRESLHSLCNEQFNLQSDDDAVKLT